MYLLMARADEYKIVMKGAEGKVVMVYDYV